MTTPAHLASGFVVYRVMMQIGVTDGSLLLAAALIGSVAPDIDGLFGTQMNNHRKTVFHAPLFWAGVFVVCFGIAQVASLWLMPYIIAFFGGTGLHIFLDWLSARTGGIRLWYPFSKESYSLFPLQPERGMVPVIPGKRYFNQWVAFWKFYFSQKFLVLVELLVVLSPVVLYMVLGEGEGS